MYHKNIKRNMGFLALILVLVSLTIGYSKIETKTTNEGVGVVEVYAGPVLAVTYGSDTRVFRSDTYREKIKTIILADEINIPSDITCGKIDDIDVQCWDVSADQNGWVMAYILPNTEDTTMYDLYIQGNGALIANQDSSYLFARFTNLTEIKNLSILDTSNVTNMGSMFSGATSLKELDLSNFKTSNVMNMSYMFYGVSGLTSLDLSNFDTSKVTNMGGMFYSMHNLTNLTFGELFATKNVTDMGYMFAGVTSLTELDLTNFDTTNVVYMQCMFFDAWALTSLDLSNFNTSKVMYMYNMFYGVRGIKYLDLSSFDMSNVEDMNHMFYKDDSSENEIIFNKASFNSEANTENMFGTSATYNITVKADEDKEFIDNLGYSNVEVIVGYIFV